MNVLIVSSGNRKNGISPIVKAQGESLRKKGINIDFFTITQRGFIGYLKACFILRNHLRANKFDIIHSHYGLCGIVALIAKKREKLVVSFMGDDIIGTNLKNGSVTRASLIIASINRYLSKKYYDHSITKSEEMLNRIKHENVSLIPNGVDLELFHPEDKSISREKLLIDLKIKLIVFASDPLRTEKNFSLAENAVEYLSDPSITLKVIHDQNPETMPDWYNSADLLILTSFHEGSPNVIKEAMACNCPIVTTEVGDVKWVIGETKGCYVTSYDAEKISEKIKAIFELTGKNERTNGRERILHLGLDSGSIADKIISVYKGVEK
jgi:teichuronic acid biosynthesis glycosyltransferase TuaC